MVLDKYRGNQNNPCYIKCCQEGSYDSPLSFFKKNLKQCFKKVAFFPLFPFDHEMYVSNISSPFCILSIWVNRQWHFVMTFPT